MTAAGAELFFPLEPGNIEDPYPHVAELREHDPVHLTLVNQWVLFRYDDPFRLLRDPSMSVDDVDIHVHDHDRVAAFEAIAAEAGVELRESTSILDVDPPDHTRLRRLVSKAFTLATIEGLRPMVRSMVDAMLDRMAEQGTTDVVTELAFPLPFDVISEVLGRSPVKACPVREEAVHARPAPPRGRCSPGRVADVTTSTIG